MSSKMSSKELAKQVRDFRVGESATDSAIFDFLLSLNTPRSLAVWLLYKHGEHQQLVDLEVDPLHYDLAERFRDDYVATSFLSKANFLRLDVSKKTSSNGKVLKIRGPMSCDELSFYVTSFGPVKKRDELLAAKRS